MEMKRRDFIRITGTLILASSMPAVYGFGDLTRKDIREDDYDRVAKLISREEFDILNMASLAPSGHNTQPWKIRIMEPGKWMLCSARQRWLPGVDPANRELMLSMGAFLRNLEIAAGARGYSVNTDILSIDPKDNSIAEISLKKGKSVPFDIEKLTSRRTVRKDLLTLPISAADYSFITGGNKDDFIYIPKGTKEASYLQTATIEANRIQAGRVPAWEELSNWIRWSNSDARKFRNGLTPASMDIKGAAGWFVRNFYNRKSVLTDDFKKKSIDMVTRQVSNYGGWIIITSQKSDIAPLISAGSKFQDMFLNVREKMIAVHPMTQILEEVPFKDNVNNELGIEKKIQFILRTGYIKKYPQPVSLRMPVSWFVSS
ncbi:MAG TPA: nitroreductase [Desulfomonilia bacterium]